MEGESYSHSVTSGTSYQKYYQKIQKLFLKNRNYQLSKTYLTTTTTTLLSTLLLSSWWIQHWGNLHL